ncbi:MAG: CHASE domain-containing protein, partial [Kiritimatiellales bacterium]|nr:CHASE domain-containing protein [Kiritimatiellales bacterium]
MKSAPIIHWPLLLATLTALTGIVISLHLQNRIAQTEADAARLTAETLRLNTEQELYLFSEVLESVCALHALSDAVNQAAMDEFVQKGLVHQHTVLGPFGLTQRINPWLRNEIEGKAKNQPGAYQVVQQGPKGTWIPAEPKSVYYPLTWQSRANGLNLPIGFDFSSLGEESRRAIEQIEQTRRPALVISTDSFSKTGNPAYWVFAPVIQGQVKPNTLYTFGNVIGFAVAALHPEVILKHIAALSGSSSELRMSLQPLPPGSKTEGTIQRGSGGWIYLHPLEAIGAQWIFKCFLPGSVTGHRSTAVLLAGLIITALMTSLLLLLSNRTRKIEAEVRVRTEELRIANTRLEENLHERVHMEEEMNELAARERHKVGRDLHD